MYAECSSSALLTKPSCWVRAKPALDPLILPELPSQSSTIRDDTVIQKSHNPLTGPSSPWLPLNHARTGMPRIIVSSHRRLFPRCLLLTPVSPLPLVLAAITISRLARTLTTTSAIPTPSSPTIKLDSLSTPCNPVPLTSTALIAGTAHTAWAGSGEGCPAGGAVIREFRRTRAVLARAVATVTDAHARETLLDVVNW